MRAKTAILAGSLAALPMTLAGQGVAVSPHVGTLGLGIDAAFVLSDAVSIRGGANFQPYAPKPDLDDIEFELNLPSPSLSAMLDLHPGGSGFRISGGLVYFGSDLELTADPTEPTEIGDEVYSPSEIGTMTGRLVTNQLAPYVGIGWGNAASASTGFFLDLGVAFHGEPGVELTVNGSLASDAEFQQELDQEIRQIEDDVSDVTVYPILSVGVRLGVG